MDPSLRLRIDIRHFSFSESNFSLRDIKFEVKRGEGIALLGPSGAGKSTLLRLLDGLYKNFEGEILLDGKEIRHLSPKEIYSKMGLLFQNPEEQLFAEVVFEDVAFGPRNMGWSKEEVTKAVERALQLVELEGYEGRLIRNLSFGEKKRVALAGLLAMGQEILLLDEPTLGLDPLLEKKFVELLQKLKRQGVTLIVATHNVDLVPYFAEKVLIIFGGRLVSLGSPREVFQGLDLSPYHLRPPLVTLLFKELNGHIPHLPLTLEEARTYLQNLLFSSKQE